MANQRVVSKKGVAELPDPYWVATIDGSDAGIGACFINTQLQLGEEVASGASLNRFNGLMTMGLKLLKQFAGSTGRGHLTEVRC